VLYDEVNSLKFDKMKYTVFVKCEYMGGSNGRTEHRLIKESKIVEVENLLDLNKMFRGITDVKILNCI
tara:strand:- start:425 stop:628 length:204 start_codon:yes stop_codon:yes gene_type:complete